MKLQSENIYYNFIGYENSGQNQKKNFIRIFKDAVPEDLWKSYCLGLGIDANDAAIKSFKIYIESHDDVQLDRYDESGAIIDED